MNKSLWQTIRPHAIALGIFFIISCAYCLPAFKGMVVSQHDVESWKGMAQQSLEFKEKYGHYPLWTNAIFSGMPAFQVATGSFHNIHLGWLHHLFTLFLPEPAGLFFLACTGFYILCMALGIRNRIAILGSLAYGFASYNAVIVMVGHTTKFAAMGYAPAVLAGILLLTQRKYLLGFIVTLVFSTMLFFQNHVQIAYYTLLIAIILAVAFSIQCIRRKELAHLGKTAGLALLAGVMGMLSYAVILFPTYDYAKETMRGGRSELTTPGDEKDKSKGGLDKSYAFQYSYGISEVLTIAVPRLYGGSGGELQTDGKAVETFAEKTGVGEDQAYNFLLQLGFRSYWGPQQGTAGAVYFGAAICILSIFGWIFYRGWHRHWILAATVLGIILAWGNHLEAVNYFLFDHLPFYNKFRAPSMALVIPQLTVPLLAVLGLNEIFANAADKSVVWKRFRTALTVSGIFAAVLILLYFMLDFKSDTDSAVRNQLSSMILQQSSQQGQPTPQIQQQAEEVGRSVANAVKEDRQSLYRSDLIRSLIFMALAIGILYGYVKNKLNGNVAAIALSVIVFIDLIGIDLRYLSSDKYIQPDEFSSNLAPTAADNQILQDKTYYRVFNSTGDPYQSSPQTARTSYYHNSVGGYHPAKLALYNDLIYGQLAKGNMQVFNMLNTKYFITADPSNQQEVVQQNPGALGPAWFVKTVKFVNNANEEMKALDNFHPKDTAIADKREQSKISLVADTDSASNIQFVENINDKATYKSSSKTGGFAVFSEVYYPKGWKATIDGKETPIARVNYVLRGLSIPAGDRTIIFTFRPSSFYTGDMITLVIGILSMLILLYGGYVLWKDYKKMNTAPTSAKSKG